jgi:dihydroxyacetone kinase
VAVLVNNLGGLSILELNVIAEEVLSQLEKLQFDISRVFIGAFVTSLNGPGFSVTILELDTEFEALLDAPTSVDAWPKASLSYSSKKISQQLVTLKTKDTPYQNGSSVRLPGKSCGLENANLNEH